MYIFRFIFVYVHTYLKLFGLSGFFFQHYIKIFIKLKNDSYVIHLMIIELCESFYFSTQTYLKAQRTVWNFDEETLQVDKLQNYAQVDEYVNID